MCVYIYDALLFYSGFEALHFLGCYQAKFGEFLAKFRKCVKYLFVLKIGKKTGFFGPWNECNLLLWQQLKIFTNSQVVTSNNSQFFTLTVLTTPFPLLEVHWLFLRESPIPFTKTDSSCLYKFIPLIPYVSHTHIFLLTGAFSYAYHTQPHRWHHFVNHLKITPSPLPRNYFPLDWIFFFSSHELSFKMIFAEFTEMLTTDFVR